MSERPVILFPAPENAERAKRSMVPHRVSKPSYARQYERLGPKLTALRTALDNKALMIQDSPTGINPDKALVFEVIDSVDNFYTAVKHVEGLEWMFDTDPSEIEPDTDFYLVDTKNERIEGDIRRKVYCVMTSRAAMEQMISLWDRHLSGEEKVFPRGYAGLRDVFVQIKDIRQWNSRDRIEETYAMEFWKDSLEIDDDTVSFEIELFYRTEQSARINAKRIVEEEIRDLQGNVLEECIIEDINYHGLLVELPRGAVQQLVDNYEEIKLARVDDIMYFRPTCQSFNIAEGYSEKITEEESFALPNGDAVIAIFDGMPIQNHHLLKSRLIIDDPDNYEKGYEIKSRSHGTSMASLVIYGDLGKHEKPISTPVYMRPVLKPNPKAYNIEEIPNDKLFVDVIHRAVKRIVQGERGDAPVAPSVKVINLSIGDSARQLTVEMSPVARLLDWLSYEYKLLFIVSAGNHPEVVDNVCNTFDELKQMDATERSRVFGSVIRDNQRKMRVLSPGESLNSITVGAIYDDFSSFVDDDRLVSAVKRGLPSPISAVGRGFRSTIKPDLFYYGGRKAIKQDFGKRNINWARSYRAPGIQSAAPYGDGSEDGVSYSFGTSDATAQLTHEAAKCHDVLNDIFLRETGDEVPKEFEAIMIKAMLTHGASWEGIADEVADATGDTAKKLSTWLGNGIPDIDRVVECTKERITVIGHGSLEKEKGHIYHLPLPLDFSSRKILRRLTVTMAYFSPVVMNKQSYRSAKLWFDLSDSSKKLVSQRFNTDWQATQKGTLQHEIFFGDDAIPWDDDLEIKVSCRSDAETLKEEIPYSIFVSFEIADGYDIDLYSAVTTSIHQKVRIYNRDVL